MIAYMAPMENPGEAGRTERLRGLALAIAATSAALVILFLGHLAATPDTPCYEGGARLLFGLAGSTDCHFRMLKPLALMFPGLLEALTGIDARYGLLIQNLVFYFLSALLIFEIIRLVFKDATQALAGTVMFITAPPLLGYGLAYVTDMAGWFFSILGVYLTLKLWNRLKDQPLWTFGFGLLMGLGTLYKEGALAGLIFFGTYVLLGAARREDKARMLLSAGIGFAVPVLASAAIIYRTFGYSFWHYLTFYQQKPLGDFYNLAGFTYAVAGTLTLYWLWFLVGAVRLAGDAGRGEVGRDVAKFLLAGAATLALWPWWPYPVNRIFYLSAPFLIGVASYGVQAFPPRAAVSIVLLTAGVVFTAVALWPEHAVLWVRMYGLPGE